MFNAKRVIEGTFETEAQAKAFIQENYATAKGTIIDYDFSTGLYLVVVGYLNGQVC